MKLTKTESNVLSPYLDRLHQDDLENVIGQFRQLAHAARERRQRGEGARMPAPGDAEWVEWLGDVHTCGVVIARTRTRGISDAAAWAYAETYRDAVAAVRMIYLPAGDRCPALNQLDALEAEREADPAQAF